MGHTNANRRTGDAAARQATHSGRNEPATHSLTIKLAQAMLAVYSGRACVGHILNRGVAGFAAFNVDGVQVGLFATLREAADALAAQAKGVSS